MANDDNGPEPGEGSWVVASVGDCPDRVMWKRRGGEWVDVHGCRHGWGELVSPVGLTDPQRGRG